MNTNITTKEHGEYEKGLVLMTYAVQELYFEIKDPNN